MFITKKHISRRTILKGAGVNLALPFLSAMVPASTALAQTAANPKCARASSISLTARSCTTLSSARRRTAGRRAGQAPTTNSTRSTRRWSRSRSTTPPPLATWRTPPPQALYTSATRQRG